MGKRKQYLGWRTGWCYPCWKIYGPVIVSIVFSLAVVPARGAPTGPVNITIDGGNSDWTAVLANPENQAMDGEGVCISANTPDSTDLDAQSDPLNDTTCSDLTPSGRDLKLYAYTWDSTNLYMYVQRWSTSSNVTDWWFYLDIDNDGRLQSGEPVLRVSWKGSNQDTNRELYDYVAVDASGDLLSNPSGDGYSMPGGITNMQSLTSTPDGGSVDASFMEIWVAWSEIGLGAPATVKFHISSSNGTNLPGSIIDNMTGPAGGGLSFVDLYVGKSASAATAWVGDSLSYTVTLTNDSVDTDATSVSLDDVLPANVTHVSSSVTSGSVSYNAGTHTVQWTGATVAFGGGTATLTVNVAADDVPTITTAAGITATNTANNLNQAEADTNATGSNTASVDITIKPKPDLVFAKLVAPSYSPIAGPTKAIPGSRVTYTVITTNQGYGEADTDSIVITDSIPATTAIYVPAGAFTFTDGAVSSGLTSLNYGGASDLTDDVEFFDGLTWNYQPTAGTDGCDSAVQQIRLNPKGTLAGATGGPPVTSTPSFNLTFTVCVQ